MSPWGWRPERTLGIWRYGSEWAKQVVAAVPYLTVLLLLFMLYFVSGTLVSARGVLFDLPDAGLGEGEKASQVVLVMPMAHETLVFFDDSRYLLGDPSSMRAFGENLADSLSRSEEKTLLVLADRRVTGGDLMRLTALTKKCGVTKVLMAEKKAVKAE